MDVLDERSGDQELQADQILGAQGVELDAELPAASRKGRVRLELGAAGNLSLDDEP